MNAAEHIPVLANAPCGKLEGTQRGGVCVFKGIPFATARRWRAPEAVAPWVGVRSARAAGAVAPQNPTALEGLIGGGGKFVQSEDCLSLNVWTPACDGGKRPVMVWIHGGAFVTGAGSLGLYNGAKLAQHGDAVIVTVNYRMGGLGFLRLAEVTRGGIPAFGNEGLLDQIAALQWVRDNIASFGGDAGNVTIFGESAGGMSVVSLLASPAARGLLHKAICQSGGGHIAHTAELGDRVASVFLKHLGIDAGDVRALESTPVEALLKAQAALIAEVDTQHDPHKLGGLAFQPVVDGLTLPVKPIDAVRAGSAKGIALIAGTTAEEWKLWSAMNTSLHAMDEEKLERWATRLFGEHAQSLLNDAQDASFYERFVAMQTKRAFREPTLRLLDAQSAHAPVHDYVFERRSPAMGGVFGACHAIELGFVFGSYSLPGADQFFGTGADADAVNDAMMSAWSSFARDGAPRVDSSNSWQRWSHDARQTMVFGAKTGATHMRKLAPSQAWSALPDSAVGP
ncbi:MAG: carboxylesterase family protein [Alphaproteobacteria bacterium]|nr:carboxylesterase family protein [Alphaproteobacteria bacterium]